LLVAQLSHQDPTKPTDPTEFVSQLSQFSSLEQLMNIKSGLDLVAITQTAGTSAQMVTFIGKEVAFDGGQVAWSPDKAPVDMRYNLDANATAVEARVVDSRGNVVDTRDLGALQAGAHAFTFDGKKADGTTLPADTYHIAIVAKDAAGNSSDVSLRGTGVVSGVTFEAGYPQLVLSDGRVLGLGQVLEVIAQTAAVSPTPAAPKPADNGPWIDDPTHTDDAHDLP